MADDIDEEPLSWEEILELFEENYVKEGNDDSFAVSPEGAQPAEWIYKSLLAEQIAEGEDDLPTGWSIEGITLSRLQSDILDEIENWGEYDDSAYVEIKLFISDDVVLFFTLANEVMQGISGEILNDTIVVEDRRGDSSLNMAKDLPQEVKEDLLYYTGLVDEGVKGEMANVRRTRNKLIHDLRNRHYLISIDNVESRLARTFDVINELSKINDGTPLFPNI